MDILKFKIAIWNANGLQQHAQEIKTFLNSENIDIMMISETHFTDKHYLHIPKYNLYHTKHPSNKAHGGTAIIIRNNIQHYESEKFSKDYLQATTVAIDGKHGPISMSAVYCPPKHLNKKEDFEAFFQTLGNKFFAGGDYNAKHPEWGSRLTTSKGRELFKAIKTNNLQCLSTGEPTYWPSDTHKIPDVIDFCVTKGVDAKKCNVESCFDLSSDHSIIILTVHTEILNKERQPFLHSSQTNWDAFRSNLNRLISLDVPLKSKIDIEDAVLNLTQNIQTASWSATPPVTTRLINGKIPTIIRDKLEEKRKLRKQWQYNRTEINKRKLNRATKELKILIQKNRNQEFQKYLENLTPTEATEYSLWKATKRLKRPQQHNTPLKNDNNTWARSDKDKAETYAKHLKNVFTPHPSQLSPNEEKDITDLLNGPCAAEHVRHRKFKIADIKQTIMNEINTQKAPGFDLISGKVLQELPENCFKLITYIFNAILRLNHVPSAWKVAQIIMIPKPGKKPEKVSSYRPISLLPMLSKVFEK